MKMLEYQKYKQKDFCKINCIDFICLRSHLSFNLIQQRCRDLLSCHKMDELSGYLRSRHVPEEDIQRMEQEKVVNIGNALF